MRFVSDTECVPRRCAQSLRCVSEAVRGCEDKERPGRGRFAALLAGLRLRRLLSVQATRIVCQRRDSGVMPILAVASVSIRWLNVLAQLVIEAPRV